MEKDEIYYTKNKRRYIKPMNETQPSDTFVKLYNYIIVDLLVQICNSNPNYCVKEKINNENLPNALWKIYKKYETETSENMLGSRLDRHKLASCICGAITELQPIVGLNHVKNSQSVNELLALHTALNVIKCFMMEEIFENSNDPIEIKNEINVYLKKNFELRLPHLEDNICDSQEYQKNIINALFWCHRTCHTFSRKCFRYDIWAYSKIFYHLELYNKPLFYKCIQNYKQHQSIN